MASTDTHRVAKTIVTTITETVYTDGHVTKETKREEHVLEGDDKNDNGGMMNRWKLKPQFWNRKSTEEQKAQLDRDEPNIDVGKVSLREEGNKPTLNEFRQEMLQLHNQYRREHDACDLTLSDSLNDYAQEWADNLARMEKFEHRKNNKYGENIFFGQKSGGMSAKDAASMWYSEIKNYHFDINVANLSCGHFTQMVWKNSRELGVGWVQHNDGTTYVVANYDPPGNVIGHYKENVSAPKKQINRF